MPPRSERRSIDKAQRKSGSSAKVYLTIPPQFLDLMDQPWRAVQAGNIVQELDLRDILMFTLRQAQVRTAGDSFRALDCFQALKTAPDGVIEMNRDDWDWMLAHFREVAHTVWKVTDGAYLVQWLENNVSETEPRGNEPLAIGGVEH